MKIVNIDREDLHIFLNDLNNLNETFRKDVTYDNITSPKKTGLYLSLKNTFSENERGERAILPRPLPFSQDF